MDKPSLRKEAKRIIREFPYKEEESRTICERLWKNEEFNKAEVILAFYPMKGEPDITPIFDERFLFPYISGNTMEFARGPFEKSPMGFLEPVSRTPVAYDKALILVPGLSFTADGKRLGRGGGFYDGYLSGHKEKLHAIGICFSVQLIDSIETEPHDEVVSEIITGN